MWPVRWPERFFSASLKCWKLRNTIIFYLCSRSYKAIWEWVKFGGIVRTGAIGTENGVLDTVAYSKSNMRYPSILWFPPSNVVVMDAILEYHLTTSSFTIVVFDLVFHFGMSQYGNMDCTFASMWERYFSIGSPPWRVWRYNQCINNSC